jgi:hypothetical protein
VLPVDEILEIQREQALAQQQKERLRKKILLDRGFQPESLLDDGNM